jgi:5-methylcytosine-specific restriction endonuclease McrA
MKFSELDLLAIGNTIQMAGAIFVGDGKTLLCYFPKDVEDGTRAEVLEMTTDDWQQFIRQTDILEAEVLARSSDGALTKTILRKSARQIDAIVQWQVFRRDGYACRYCGRNDVPLTVDHLVCWEEGGPSTLENMVSSCKKDNKIRGNLTYEEWLRHPRYLQVSKSLSEDVRALNERVAGTLAAIPRKIHVMSR